MRDRPGNGERTGAGWAVLLDGFLAVLCNPGLVDSFRVRGSPADAVVAGRPESVVPWTACMAASDR
ncbi:MAG: hypothetical protein QF689_11825, partial [Candidatus Latescibacteria bacterium]|nr:hypothetical protein [Candidatus Latescibacterota bacterium]